MNIYQGEPVGFTIKVKNDQGQWESDLSNLHLEALIKDSLSQTITTWDSAKGTITYSTVVISGSNVGLATFTLSSAETAQMCGNYGIEVAKVISNGRAIGVATDTLNINPANIKMGV